MRNATTTLTNVQAMAARLNREALEGAGTGSVTFTYAKREGGEVSTREGQVIGFHGAAGMSNDSVRMATPQGERVFNLYLMRGITR